MAHKHNKAQSFNGIGRSIVRVETNGLRKGDEGLLMTEKATKSSTFVVIGNSIIRIVVDGLIRDDESFLIMTLEVSMKTLEVSKSNAFVKPFPFCLLRVHAIL